jgi:hypothetical protein
MNCWRVQGQEGRWEVEEVPQSCHRSCHKAERSVCESVFRKSSLLCDGCHRRRAVLSETIRECGDCVVATTSRKVLDMIGINHI